MAKRYNYDERKLKPLQREAALALVEYEFTPKKERKTKQEIADEIGITRQGMHKWETQDKNFIAYKNSIAADFTDSHAPMVYKKLLETIENGSVRGIELFLKRMGDLADQSEVTIKTGEEVPLEERREELLKRVEEAQAAAKAEAGGTDGANGVEKTE